MTKALKDLIAERKDNLTKLRHSNHILTLAEYLDKMLSKEDKIFWIDDGNKKEIENLFDYFFHSKIFENNEMKLSKGITVVGNVGSGKTILMNGISKLLLGVNRFRFIECTDIAEREMKKDYRLLSSLRFRFYKDSLNNICLDDLGDEKPVYNYETMELVAKFRNMLWLRFGIKTHYTTNLSMDEIENRYGERMASRIKQMNNVVYLGKDINSLDRRIQWKS